MDQAPETVVAEVIRRGKLVYAEPYFTAGLPLLLEQKARTEVSLGDLVVVRLGRGRSRVERVLGAASKIETVLEGLLVETGRRREFELYDLPSPPTEDRVDLRDLVTFTIDPETAEDFDDAISVLEDEGGVRVFVHIADVSAYLPSGAPLDYGAAARAFSTYVPGNVAPMLPPELSEDACSLRPNRDRLCVTTEVLLDGEYRRGEPRFYRSLIRSNARFSYGQVERILSGKESTKPELLAALELTGSASSALRRRRFARGALRIERPELEFSFDGEGGVERAWFQSEPRAHALIEDLMILANEAVAELLAERGREALYRVHERPDPQSLVSLVDKLTKLEVPTPPAPEEGSFTPQEAELLAAQIAASVNDYVGSSDRGREAFPTLVLRALKQARYDPRNLGHSGLASSAYCHFTSPIRRYPDIVCHRALLRELGLSDDAPAADLEALAEQASATERVAAQIEFQADGICLAWLLERRQRTEGPDERFTGEIIGLIGAGLFARFGDPGSAVFEGFLPARRLGGDYFELDPLGTALEGRRGGRLRLGDEIEVEVERIERHSGKVELRRAGSERRRKSATPTSSGRHNRHGGR
ncbi:MAG: ribonuclease R family protein [Gaiellaceae bacterium]